MDQTDQTDKSQMIETLIKIMEIGKKLDANASDLRQGRLKFVSTFNFDTRELVDLIEQDAAGAVPGQESSQESPFFDTIYNARLFDMIKPDTYDLLETKVTLLHGLVSELVMKQELDWRDVLTWEEIRTSIILPQREMSLAAVASGPDDMIAIVVCESLIKKAVPDVETTNLDIRLGTLVNIVQSWRPAVSELVDKYVSLCKLWLFRTKTIEYSAKTDLIGDVSSVDSAEVEAWFSTVIEEATSVVDGIIKTIILKKELENPEQHAYSNTDVSAINDLVDIISSKQAAETIENNDESDEIDTASKNLLTIDFVKDHVVKTLKFLTVFDLKTGQVVEEISQKQVLDYVFGNK